MAVPLMGLHSATPKVTDPYGTSRHSVEGKRIIRKKDWVAGWWENIGPEPIYCQTKEDLKRACLAESKRQGRTIIPKAFMKPTSQGRGIEWTF